MTTATVTFDPEVDTAEDVIAMVERIYDLPAAEPGKPATPATGLTVGSTTWSLPKMRRYVAALTEGGAKVLRVMVDDGPHVDMDHVQAKVGMTGTEYAGTMSTFGHARNNTRGVHDVPYIRSGRSYYLAPDVAALADTALAEHGV